MFDSKILITLISLVVGIVAVNHFKNKDEKTREGFPGMGPSLTWKIDRVAAASPAAAKKGDFYSVPGTYQSILNPRFSNVDYGANIRYNFPSYKNQASPSNPLTFNSMIGAGAQNYPRENYSKENYIGNNSLREDYSCSSAGGSCVTDCRKGGLPMDYHGGAPIEEPGYAAGNYNEQVNKAYKDSKFPATTSALPVGDMTSINAAGDETQPVVYDRYIYANRNSILRSQGDFIRGDLPIVPCNTGWFQVSVQPNIDLNQGALAVLGGVTNEQGRSLAELIYKTSGKAETSISGVNYRNKDELAQLRDVNQANMFGGGLSAGQTDINVSAFP